MNKERRENKDEGQRKEEKKNEKRKANVSITTNIENSYSGVPFLHMTHPCKQQKIFVLKFTTFSVNP